jgi:hypothetical protein
VIPTDLDFDAASLRIERTRIASQNGPMFTVPKGGRALTVGLTPMAVESLRRHRAAQNAERLAAGAFYEASDLIFATPTGAPLRPS